MTRSPHIGGQALAILVGLVVAATAVADEAPTFDRDVLPIFARRCNACHNRRKVGDPDASGRLALDTYESAMAGVEGKPIVVAGKSAQSVLHRRLVTADEDERMPRLDGPLPPAQVALIARWIDAGARRGEPLLAGSKETARPPRRLVRSLDVVIPVATRAPAGVAGFGPGGAIDLALKVGPLPSITALAFRGDGRMLAVGTHGRVVLWDLADARPAAFLDDVPGPVHALAFSRDGRRLAVGAGLPARSGVVQVYSVPDGTLVNDFEGHGDVVFGLAFRPDDGELASASLDQTVRIWDLVRGLPRGVFRGHSDFVYDVAYTHDGTAILTVSKDRTIKQVDARTLKERRTYSGATEDVLALALQPRGGKFVTAGNEPALRWWTLDGEKPTMQVGGHSGPVHQLAFSGDGTRLISAGGDASVRLWDGSSGVYLRSLPGAGDWQYAVALSGDGKLAAGGGGDGLVRVWDADAGALRATILQPPSPAGSANDWLVVAPGGSFDAGPGLRRLLRWRVGGVEVPGAGPESLFARAADVIHALRGEPVPRPEFSKPRS